MGSSSIQESYFQAADVDSVKGMNIGGAVIFVEIILSLHFGSYIFYQRGFSGSRSAFEDKYSVHAFPGKVIVIGKKPPSGVSSGKETQSCHSDSPFPILSILESRGDCAFA